MEAVATVAAVRTTAGAARASTRAAISCPLTDSAERGTVGVQAKQCWARFGGRLLGMGSGLSTPGKPRLTAIP
eukprot:3827252-Prymnesium_polylepis.1